MRRVHDWDVLNMRTTEGIVRAEDLLEGQSGLSKLQWVKLRGSKDIFEWISDKERVEAIEWEKILKEADK